MVSVCLPSDALLEHLPSYLGFSYLGCGYLHCCSSKAQLLLLTLNEEYLLTAVLPDLQYGIVPLRPPVPEQPWLLGHGVAPLSCRSWPQAWGSSCGMSYSTFKVRRGGGEEIPLVQGKEQWLRFAGTAMKRYPTSKVRETQVRQ